MTYKEQLELEKINKDIIKNILNNVNKEFFIDFYINHTRLETCNYFNIRNTKLLVKILKLLNYDFSIKKPSKYKGKKAARSAESYINGGKKSSNTQKEHWKNKTEKENFEWSQKQKIAHNTEAFKMKIKAANEAYRATLTEEQKENIKNKKAISNKATWFKNKDEILEKTKQTCQIKFGKDSYTKTEEYKNIIQDEENLKQRALKTNLTKTNNNSWNLSKPEECFYNYLCNKYSTTDVIRQYRDSRYPFNCDFYIKSKDLFIELNFTWSHGGHKFNIENEADRLKAANWAKKAKTSKYYENALNVWTVKDPEKFKKAEENNLNYIVYYSEAELYKD